MLVSTTINEHELPGRFRQLLEIAPWDAWGRRAQELKDRERQNPFLTEHFDERYTIERCVAPALACWYKTRRFPSVRGPQGGRCYELYSFVHVLASVYQCLSPAGQKRVRGYVIDGLKSDGGLAAFAHELAVVAHLWSAGFDVEFCDVEGRARFDFLARKEGVELEVDCKTASADVGRQIHRRRALELFNCLRPSFENLVNQGRSRTVDIVLPGALHGADAYLDAVRIAASEAILQDKSLSIAQVADVSLGKFDLDNEPSFSAGAPTREALKRMAERIGRATSHVTCLGRPGAAAVFAAVSSRKPDKVVDGIYRALKASAESQFGDANPALIAIRLLDLTMEQLGDLGSGPNNLGAISNRLFAGDRRGHLFGVAVLSPADAPSETVDAVGVSFSSAGAAALFRRAAHPLSDDPRLVLFQRR